MDASVSAKLLREIVMYTLATWCKEPTLWKRPWCWQRLKTADKGMTEDEVVGWHHWLYGHEFEQAPGVGDGQEGHRVTKSWTQLSNWTELDCIDPGFRSWAGMQCIACCNVGHFSPCVVCIGQTESARVTCESQKSQPNREEDGSSTQLPSAHL